MAIMRFGGKVSDMFCLSVVDDDGKEVIDYEGYVPSGLRIGGGDYLEMFINLDTGQILGWCGEDVASVKAACGIDVDQDEE